MDSILDSTKKVLGIDETYTHFDVDIIMHINTALFSLSQLGVSITDGYVVKDKTDTWTMLLGSATDLEAIKSYIYYKVRLAFDPPKTSYAIKAVEDQVKELEWRLSVHSDTTLHT